MSDNSYSSGSVHVWDVDDADPVRYEHGYNINNPGRSREVWWRRVILHLLKDSEQTDDEVDAVHDQPKSNEVD